MVLSHKDRGELHAALAEYLKIHEFFEAHAAFIRQLETNSSFDAISHDRESMLEKRWNTIRRLNLRNIELDAQVKQLQAQLLESQDPTKSSKKGKTTNIIPNTPSLQTFSGHRDTVNCLALHANENVCVSGSEDGTIRVWDIESRQHIKTLRNHSSNVTCLAFEPINWKLLASCSSDQSVKIFDATTFECLNTLVGHDDAVSSLCWVGDVDMTLISSSRDCQIKVWDGKRASLRQTFVGPSWVRTMAATPLGGGQLLIGGHDEQVLMYTNILAPGGIKEENAVSIGSHTNSVTMVVFSNFEADITMVEAHGSPIQKAEMKEILKMRNGNGDDVKKAQIQTNEGEWLMSIKYQPKYVASSSRDKNIHVYDVQQDGAVVMTLQKHDNWVRAIAFTPSGKYLVSCGDDGMMLVFDLAVKRLYRKIEAHGHFVTSLVLHPNNKPFMMTGSADHTVKLWPCN